MIYEVGDVTNMKYTDESFNAVIGNICQRLAIFKLSRPTLFLNNYFLRQGNFGRNDGRRKSQYHWDDR